MIETDDHIRLTTSGRQHIEGEIGRIEARAAEMRELVSEAHEDRTADDDERAGAFAMLDELGRLEARQAELRSILDRAIDAAPRMADVVDIGTVVRVRDEDGEESIYTVVNPAEAAPAQGRVSMSAPLGRALVGHRAGERVTVDAPSGAWEVSIVEIGLAA